MTQLALSLTGAVGRQVTDESGLGLQGFDYEIRWTPIAASPDAPPAVGPSIFTALEEQLGLKLIPKHGPIDVLVIDSIKEPESN
jgi:uncharacterized protein (TIGR03435 family)